MQETLEGLLPDQFDAYAADIQGAVLALVLFVLGWVVSKWAHAIVLRALRSRSLDEALARFLASMAQYLVLAAAVITALEKVGVEATSLVALLGAAGLAIGLALQGSLANFASGVMILLFRPFTIGHRVEVAGHTGGVEEVGLFATTLKTPDEVTIIIPNSEITASSIVNYTSAGKIRLNVDIGVGYGTEYADAEKTILEAVRRVDGVLDDPGADVVFGGFGASSVDLVARPWCHPDDAPGVTHRTRIAIYDALNAAGIEIPFNQLVLHKADASA